MTFTGLLLVDESIICQSKEYSLCDDRATSNSPFLAMDTHQYELQMQEISVAEQMAGRSNKKRKEELFDFNLRENINSSALFDVVHFSPKHNSLH